MSSLFHRRDFLRASLLASGMVATGLDVPLLSATSWPSAAGSFPDGKKMGQLNFVGEIPLDFNTQIGTELDGRLYTDLSSLSAENPVTPIDNFYLRTCSSKLLPDPHSWSIQLSDLAAKSTNLSMARLQSMQRPMGTHVMECAGNTRGFHFGLLSAARWTGVPVSELLQTMRMDQSAGYISISGYDKYSEASDTSVPGASWLFRHDDLRTSRAFLATGMNGRPLPRDHGAPVRLIVPGWYGCACIKWVNEITLLRDNAPSTSQMREYAARTHQDGVPSLARDFRPAIMQYAAMPIRIEKWQVGESFVYAITGILWGGSTPVKSLQIRFNPEENYVPVDHIGEINSRSWSFWKHTWRPSTPGTYLIRLRISDPIVEAKRLDAGYYMRAVEIQE